MAGHSKWKQIKHYKAAADAKRGALFTKLIREITMAAKIGGGDPNGNPRLRLAIDTARANSMPKENIERAVKKGTGELEGVDYQEVTYEGYGPGGVALMVECLTDNRHRTAGDVRATLSKGGGHLAAEGSVSWVFTKKGSISIKPGPSEDEVMEKALEAGAEDVLAQGGDGFEIRTEPGALHNVAQALEKSGVTLGEQRWTYVPSSTVKLEGEAARKMLKLMDSLEDSEDVQNIYANFEVDDALIQQLA